MQKDFVRLKKWSGRNLIWFSEKSCSKASWTIGSRWPCVGRSGQVTSRPLQLQTLYDSVNKISWKAQSLFPCFLLQAQKISSYTENCNITKIQSHQWLHFKEKEFQLRNISFHACSWVNMHNTPSSPPPRLNCRNLSKLSWQNRYKRPSFSNAFNFIFFFEEWVENVKHCIRAYYEIYTCQQK